MFSWEVMMLQTTIKDTNRTAINTLYSIRDVLAPEVMTALCCRLSVDDANGGSGQQQYPEPREHLSRGLSPKRGKSSDKLESEKLLQNPYLTIWHLCPASRDYFCNFPCRIFSDNNFFPILRLFVPLGKI